MIVAIVNRKSFKGIMTYKLVAVKKTNGEINFSVGTMNEKEVINKILSNKIKPINASVVDGELKGITGSLSRFDSQPKPFVILTEMVNVVGDTTTVIGYRVADSNGTVAAISKRKLIDMCKQGRSIQNAVFIDDSEDKVAYIRAFEEGQFDQEVVQLPKSKKSEYSVKSNVDYENREKQAKEGIGSTSENKEQKKENPLAQFTPEQREVLQRAHREGYDLKYLWEPKFTVGQMEAILKVLQDGNDPSSFDTPEYSEQQMQWLGLGLKTKVDITNELNPEFNLAQLSIIRNATLTGVDTSKFANPKISALNMEKMYVQLSDNILEEFVGAYMTEVQWTEFAEQ